MGMGGMFLTVQGDPSTILGNPAGLASTPRWQYFVMGMKTLQEVNYMVLGTAIPVENLGAFGFALVNRGVSDIPLTGQLVMNGGAVDYSGIQYANYNEDLLMISYANRAELWEKNINYGLSTKFFQKRTTVHDSGNAAGFNLDLGAQFDLNRDLSLAAKLQNLLVSSEDNASAGSIVWDTGEVEAVDSYLILGVSNKTLYRNVLLGLDFKKNMTRKDYPVFILFGLEWHPLDALFLRCGVGQGIKAPDVSNSGDAVGLVNNYSVGVGLNLFDWRFDYAYRPDMEIKDLTTHVFSISYIGPEPNEKVTTENGQEELVSTSSAMYLTSPEDRLITTSVMVLAQGRVFNNDRYILNGEEYKLDPDGKFSKEVILALGINDITLGMPGTKQKLIRKVLRLADFKDIGDSPYKNAITNIATLGYIRGDFPDTFNPKRYVTRAEMATLVIKINRFMLPLSMKGMWSDVDVLASQGILKGFPDGLMRQDEKLTKAQVAMVLARVQGLTENDQAVNYSYLNNEHWAQGSVQALVDTKLYNNEDFLPLNGYVTKEELVDLFSRLPSVQKSVNKMLNFDETGAEEDYSRRIDTVFMKRSSKETELNDTKVFNDLVNQDVAGSNMAGGAAPAAELNSEESADFRYQQLLLAETVKAVPQTSAGAAGAGTTGVTVYAPADKSVVYQDYINVKGNVNNAAKVYVGGQLVPVKNGAFSTAYHLKNGKNLIIVKVFDQNGKYQRVERKILKLKSFSDIQESDPDKKIICGLATLGFVGGDKNNQFNPSYSVSKIKYANVLAKAYGLNAVAPAVSPFTDLSAKNPGYAKAYALHVQGYMRAEGKLYKPNTYLTRSFAVVVLDRLEKIDVKNIPANVKPFNDVDESVWANRQIAGAKAAGLIDEDSGSFRPNEKLNNKNLALFLAQAKPVKAKLNNLLDWNSGY